MLLEAPGTCERIAQYLSKYEHVLQSCTTMTFFECRKAQLQGLTSSARGISCRIWLKGLRWNVPSKAATMTVFPAFAQRSAYSTTSACNHIAEALSTSAFPTP